MKWRLANGRDECTLVDGVDGRSAETSCDVSDRDSMLAAPRG